MDMDISDDDDDNDKIEPMFPYWPCNYTLQVNVYGLPDLEYLQRNILGSILEKTKTKVLSLNLILDDFIENDYKKCDRKFKSIKVMIFKNIGKGHQLKVIGVPSKNKVYYVFRIVYVMLLNIPDKITKRPLKFDLSSDKMKITNIVFGWYLPTQLVNKYFNDFINISSRLNTTCVHRHQKFPQLCIKKMKYIDDYEFSCNISSKGHCTVPGQKKLECIGKIQLLILKDFIEMEREGDYSSVCITDNENEEEELDLDIQTKIRNVKLQLFNTFNCDLFINGRKFSHKKIIYPSKLHPPTNKTISKLNARFNFDETASKNLHQKLEFGLFKNENVCININEIVD